MRKPAKNRFPALQGILYYAMRKEKKTHVFVTFTLKNVIHYLYSLNIVCTQY